MGNINNIETSYPLSPMQEAMLLGYILAPESGIYTVQIVGILHEELDIAAFRKAWTQIISRHSILRTAFRWEDIESPLQDVYTDIEIPLEIVDWQWLSKEEQDSKFNQFLKTDRVTKIDLKQVPVMRLKVFQIATAEFKFVWTYNHIILDGLSHEIFLNELFQHYEANHTGKEISLPTTIPYKEYIDWLTRQDYSKSEEYWREILKGFKSPTPVSPQLSNQYVINNRRNFDEAEIRVSEDVTIALQKLASDNQVSLNNIIQGAWGLLLSRYSGEHDVVFGTVRAGRHWGKPPADSMIGLFMHNLPMRLAIYQDNMLVPWLKEIRQAQYSLRDHENTPLNKVQQWSEVPRSLPLFESLLVFLNSDLTTLMQSRRGAWLNREFFWSIVDDGYPLTLYANVSSHIILKIAYDTDRFDSTATRWILENVKLILEEMAGNPGTLGEITTLPLPIVKPQPEELTSQNIQPAPVNSDRALARRSVIMRRQQIKQDTIRHDTVSTSQNPIDGMNDKNAAMKIAMSATFTAEPAAETIEFWGQKLQRPFKIEFAPYNQVFQQLLGSSTLFSDNSGGINIVLIRFEDWIRDKKLSTDDKKLARIEENVNNLILALKSSAGHSSATHMYCICPASPSYSDESYTSFFRKMKDRMIRKLSDTSNIFHIESEELIHLYCVDGYYNAISDELGSVPYTPEFYTALGTAIARKLYAIFNTPYKVIVLDCDQTLWSGICGEDGPLGIKIDPPRQMLQEFMVEQYKAGMLICLCSKNNQEDVDEVFKQHPEMPLRMEHITASMINWNSKSENLKALSKRLDLGLDSFIFIDDNPVECSEVQTFCPEVLTFCLPEPADRIPGFLKHIWAFDHLKITDEDKKRTELYQQDTQRKSFQEQSITLTDFITGLELKVRIEKAQPQQLSRIAQLTQRTNQFNMTTIRRSEREIRELCDSGMMDCLACEVSDRFGDYGLVGAILFSIQSGIIKVDIFLLSCRAMGRGVEHQMLAQLGIIARERGLDYVEVPYVLTSKNQPAFDFLESLSSGHKQQTENGFLCKFPASYTSSVTYTPENKKSAHPGETPKLKLALKEQVQKMTVKAEMLNDIASNFNCAKQMIHKINNESQKKRPDFAVHYTAPASEIEHQVASLWQRILGIDRVGVNDNFFDIGGTSVKGVQLIAQINRDFGVNLPIITLFEKPTVSSLSAMLVKEIESRNINTNLTIQRST